MITLLKIIGIYLLGVAIIYYILTRWNHIVFFFEIMDTNDDGFNIFLSFIWPVFIIVYILGWIAVGLYSIVHFLLFLPIKKLVKYQENKEKLNKK